MEAASAGVAVTEVMGGIPKKKCKDNRAPHTKHRSKRTAYGRRVTSKTFTILGASTPDIRISTAWASRKQKVMALTSNCKMSGRLCLKCTTLRCAEGALSLVTPASMCQATEADGEDYASQHVHNMTERLRSWVN
jgi:hypothetical protein